jgi:hypothetical protein
MKPTKLIEPEPIEQLYMRFLTYLGSVSRVGFIKIAIILIWFDHHDAVVMCLEQFPCPLRGQEILRLLTERYRSIDFYVHCLHFSPIEQKRILNTIYRGGLPRRICDKLHQNFH